MQWKLIEQMAFRLALLAGLLCLPASIGFCQTESNPKLRASTVTHRQVLTSKKSVPSSREPEPVIVKTGTGVLTAPTVFQPTPFVQWSVSATSQSFQISQPGLYAARWAQLTIRSNSEVVIDFERFADLQSRAGGDGGVVPWDLGLAVGVTTPDQVSFVPAVEFNRQDVHLTRQESKLYQCDLWSRVTVTPATVANEYQCRAKITIVLENAVDYAEPEESTK